MIGDYINQDTKTQFKCDYGHRWSSTPDSVMRISGCPKCAKYGYKETLPGWVYVLKFENFIKFGITNNLKSRLYRHLLNNGKYELIITKCYATGKEARLVENLIKTLFALAFFVTSEYFLFPHKIRDKCFLNNLQTFVIFDCR